MDDLRGELDDLRRRIDALERLEEIRSVYNRYCSTVDAGDLEAYVALFADDIVMKTDKEVVGKAALRSYVETYLSSPVRDARHYITNLEIELDGELRRARCKGGFVFTGKTSEARVLGLGESDDLLERRDGRWVFIRKVNAMPTFLTIGERAGQGDHPYPWNT